MGRGLCPQESESLQWKHPIGGESRKLRNLSPTLRVRGGTRCASLGSRVSQAGRLFERPVYRGRQSPHLGHSGLEDGEREEILGRLKAGHSGSKV